VDQFKNNYFSNNCPQERTDVIIHLTKTKWWQYYNNTSTRTCYFLVQLTN